MPASLPLRFRARDNGEPLLLPLRSPSDLRVSDMPFMYRLIAVATPVAVVVVVVIVIVVVGVVSAVGIVALVVM